MPSVRRLTTTVLLCSVLALPVVISGCGGDGGGGGGGLSEVTITINNCDATTYAQYGIICIDFTATGPATTFDLLAQFIGGPSGPLVEAYEVPPGLEASIPINPPSNSQNLVIPSNGATINGRFCWFAGADLGFLGAIGIQFFLTPLEDGTQVPIGPIVSGCPAINYLGGGTSVNGNGPPVGTNGRAAHCAENVSDKSITIAGGYTSDGFGGFTSYGTADRFTFDMSNFSYGKNVNALTMRSLRTDHACSFFLDPTTEHIKVLITGGADFAGGLNSAANNTADVYCFSPQPDSIVSTSSNMNAARRGHTATWIPSNKVVIIGGETGGATPATLGSVELYDPIFDTFSPLGAVMNFPRRGHTATLLPTGKILVAGGFALSAPTTALPAELFDPNSQSFMAVGAPLVNRVHHTATRLANGWVLLAGGLNVTTGLHSSSADIFEPELGGGMGSFTATIPLMSTPRAYHGASLLGTGDALITGGEGPGPAVTTSAEVFLYQTLAFTPTISMNTARAEHSSTGTSCGPIVLIGGRSGATSNFLNTLEIFAYDNMNPTIATAFTATSPMAGTVYVDMTVTDPDADGGYVVIRFRPFGMGMYRLCTIDQQNPSTAPNAFPNMQVVGMPNQALPYAFRWNFAADGLSTGQTVEIEILPVGVTLGTPVNLTFQLP
jgi:Galactose oxidase, central domain